MVYNSKGQSLALPQLQAALCDLRGGETLCQEDSDALLS